MFDDQDTQDSATTTDDGSATAVSPFPSSTGASAMSDSPSQDTSTDTTPVLPTFDTPVGSDTADSTAAAPLGEPATPADSLDDSSLLLPADPLVEPTSTPTDDEDQTKTEEPATDVAAPVSSESSDNDLSGMKKEALDQLQPLFEHLELGPEEEFKTTMMMIQANDDKSLLKKAFEAAKKISDDKARSHALLDVINEINYFTQKAS